MAIDGEGEMGTFKGGFDGVVGVLTRGHVGCQAVARIVNDDGSPGIASPRCPRRTAWRFSLPGRGMPWLGPGSYPR